MCKAAVRPRLQSCNGRRCFARFQAALPHDRYAPSKVIQKCVVALIPQDVPSKLVFPEYVIARGRCGVAAARMPMPEASVNQYDRLPLRQNNVRSPGKVAIMESITKAGCMQRLAHDHFRLGITTLDAGHHSRSSCSFDYIHRMTTPWQSLWDRLDTHVVASKQDFHVTERVRRH